MVEIADVIEWCRREAQRRGWVEFSPELLAQLTLEQAQQLARALQATTLMRLPEQEIAFFEWLRQADPAVWQDLWGDAGEELYVVGISFLPFLLREPRRGFPICDLVSVENYYFTPAHITPVEGQAFLEAAREALLEGKPLTLAQEFLLEVSTGPLDIWHFAYHRHLPVAAVKEAVAELVAGKALLHFRSAEDVAEYVTLE
ncbi:hypothetical protein HRbin21_01320 [bacterium HR21]|jgi:hypothetical protein|nr:hypothetical protein HRbin21_01320 [bacterium HR21]